MNQHTLHCLLAHDRPKERRPGDALGLLQALVECRAEGSIATPNFGCNGQDSIECPGGALHHAFKRVVIWIKQRDEEMTSSEEDMVQLPRFRLGDEALQYSEH